MCSLSIGGSGGMLSQENFLTFQPLRPFLVASEHPVGEKPVSDIHWFSSILIVECCVSLTARSKKLQLVYGQNCHFWYFHHSNFLHTVVSRASAHSRVSAHVPYFKAASIQTYGILIPGKSPCTPWNGHVFPFKRNGMGRKHHHFYASYCMIKQ